MKLGNIQTKHPAKQKKTNPVSVMAMGIALMLFFGAFIGYAVCTRMNQLTGNLVDIYDAIDNGSLKKNAYISIDVDAVIGNYAEMSHYSNNKVTGTDQYYIIWLDDDSFISISTDDSKLIDDLEELSADTWAVLAGTSDEFPDGTQVKGTISDMTSELKGYYDETLDYVGVLEDDGCTVYYLNLEIGDDQNENVGWLVFCVIFFVLGMVVLIIGIKQKKKQEKKSDAEKYNEEKTQQMKTLEEEQLERIANPAFDENPENTENQ